MPTSTRPTDPTDVPTPAPAASRVGVRVSAPARRAAAPYADGAQWLVKARTLISLLRGCLWPCDSFGYPEGVRYITVLRCGGRGWLSYVYLIFHMLNLFLSQQF